MDAAPLPMAHTLLRNRQMHAMRTRDTIVPSLNERGLEHLDQLLTSFHSRYPTNAGDVFRFEFLLDEMFDVFRSLNNEAAADGPIECFSMTDNLDTGNAKVEPFPPFVSGLRRGFENLDGYRGYVGPRPIDGLSDDVMAWLVRTGFIAENKSRALSLAVGAGTVHLYDMLCRLLIRRPGDIVLIPEVTYGFFVPQVERSRGRLHVLKAPRRSKIDIADAVAAVDCLNASLLRAWSKSFSLRLTLYLAEAQEAFGARLRACDDRAVAELHAMIRHAAVADEADRALAEFVRNTLCAGDDGLAKMVLGTPLLPVPAPPRVVAYLHINPNLFGVRYSASQTALLTREMEARQVSVIEDIAYHSLGCRIGDLRSCQNFGRRSFSLLGLSKPLAIANCRLGLLIGPTDAVRPIYRITENSIGFVSTLLQQALRSAFQDLDQLDEYLHSNWVQPSGYRARRDLAIACLEGWRSPNLEDAFRRACRDTILQGVSDFFAWKRGQGIEIYDEHHVFADGTRASSPQEYQARIAQAFVLDGLRRWFELSTAPDSGFFLIVDCARLIRNWRGRRPKADCAFDVFAFLAVLFGVRTIPEECMGDLNFAGSTRLRLSFSVPQETLLRAMVTCYIGLHQAEAMLEAHHARTHCSDPGARHLYQACGGAAEAPSRAQA
jgi:aspartate/methionine/tyrosine aminotransferase